MPELPDSIPTFNLWRDPWIVLERRDGEVEHLGIEQALLQAHEYTAIYDPSPLVVVGIHRLLAAVLQAALNPRKPQDLRALWHAGRFPLEAVQVFGQQYAARFDLFSADVPFLQSADLPLRPDKRDKIKTVAYLAADIPAGTAVTHYHHGAEDAHIFCPACAAGGLVTIPPFATAGGSGIKPSINGVPPIYVLPGGDSVFEGLAASLILPPFQPKVASRSGDAAWWDRRPVVGHSQEVYEVGYLHSLTFPARRVRLHPERLNAACTRCGRTSEWGVRTMVFEMGESRPKDAPFWRDPFAAYRVPEESGSKAPYPIRPSARIALWREFAGLFLPQSSAEGNKTLPANVLYQLANPEIREDVSAYPFRCIGLRTDMKAKVFEWIDAEFEVPPALVRDPTGAAAVREAIQFAAECASVIRGVFAEVIGKKRDRHQGLRARMDDQYWAVLSGSFRQFILMIAAPEQRETVRLRWLETVEQQALRSFTEAADALGDNAASLRQRVWGEAQCRMRLANRRKKYLSQEETPNE